MANLQSAVRAKASNLVVIMKAIQGGSKQPPALFSKPPCMKIAAHGMFQGDRGLRENVFDSALSFVAVFLYLWFMSCEKKFHVPTPLSPGKYCPAGLFRQGGTSSALNRLELMMVEGVK